MSAFSTVERALEYEDWDPNQETRQQVSKMLSDGDIPAMRAILDSRLQFGTAGLRGPMGPGFNRMNELVVLQTTQGLIKYIETLDADAKSKVRI